MRPEGAIASGDAPVGARAATFGRMVRSVPIRWRILAIAAANSALALILLLVIWNGAQVLVAAWQDLRRVQDSERFLSALGADAERLQGNIHRYFAVPDPNILAKIVDLRESLVSRLRVQARLDPLLAGPTRDLTDITERFVTGFDALRETRDEISRVYDQKIVKPSKEMAGLYAIITSASADPNALIWPALGKSREAFNEMILSANAFYLSGAQAAARDAIANAASIQRTVPVIRDMSTNEIQQRAIGELKTRAELFGEGLNELRVSFAKHGRLLNEVVDGNAEAMSDAIDRMRAGIHELEQSAQTRFDRTLQEVAVKLGVLAVGFVALVALMGIAIARSVSDPLGDLRGDMTAIMTGHYDRRISGLRIRDEIGDMARAVDVFRGNAIAKREIEEDLRAAKEKAEATLDEIREMQTTLIEAEKLAALGGLVAGVAHEVNNPVGISLTVASSLAARSEAFRDELSSGQIRRSKLEDFTGATRLAASQLVANLQRAAELIQSFKQVAVDRSQAERRSFDLAQAVDQILASLRPSLRTSKIRLVVDIPDGVVMDSFPGPLGQILTNLLLNSVHHAFGDGISGTISIVARVSGQGQIRLVFRDDGRGMSEDVQRHAFDPFFTTRRGSGGTGLGLHIVYNLVTRQLGGRIVLSSAEGSGTSFLLVLPLRAPDGEGRGGLGPLGGAEGRTAQAHVAS